MVGLLTILRRQSIRAGAFAIALGALIGWPSLGVMADDLRTTSFPTVAPAAVDSSGDEFPLAKDNTRSLASLLPLITEEAVAGIVVYPGQFVSSKAVRHLPVEVVAADLENHLGVDLRRIEFAIVFLENARTQPLSLGVVVKFTDDFDWRRIPVGLLRETVYGTLDGRPYRKGKGALNPSLLLLDNKTLILAPDQTLARMLATREAMPTDESISQQLSQGIGKALDIHVVANTVSLRALVGLQLEQLEPQTETWQALAQLLDDVERFEIRARLSQQFAVGAVMDATSNDAALRMQSWWESWSQSVAGTGQDAVSDALPIARSVPGNEPTVLPDDATRDRARQFKRYLQRSLQQHLARQSVRVTGNRLQWGMRGDHAAQVSTCAAVTMLLNPAVQAVNPVVDRWQSMDGMQRLSDAMLAYASANERFPARASFSANSQPLLSWRVHLLPFLGYRELYEQFHLDEAWDGPNNRLLIQLMPAVYQNPRRPCDFRTTFTVPVGVGTMFEGLEGIPQRDIQNGPGNTLMLVEADEDHAVYWTQPDDFSYDEQNPWNGLGKLREAGFLGARADGTVRFFVRSLDPYQLRAFFLLNGGETQLH